MAEYCLGYLSQGEGSPSGVDPDDFLLYFLKTKQFDVIDNFLAGCFSRKALEEDTYKIVTTVFENFDSFNKEYQTKIIEMAIEAMNVIPDYNRDLLLEAMIGKTDCSTLEQLYDKYGRRHVLPKER